MNQELGLPNNGDISEALRASEISYRRLFEAAQDGILILDSASGRVMDVNPFLVKLLGYSHDDMVGSTVGDLSPFKDLVSNQKMLEKLQKVGYVRYENLPLETSDGRKIAVEFVCNVYQAGNHQVIQCNIRDITERHQAEMALRASEERYRLINDASLDQIYSYDLDNRFTSANRVLCADLGRSADEVIGKTYWELGFPESLCREWDELHRQVYALGQKVKVLSLPMPNGTMRHFEVNLHLIHDGAGVVTGIAGVNRNITERKRDEAALQESNQRIQLATESADLAVWDWDLQAGTMVWDDRMFELYGKTRLEINGTVQDWKDGLHPEDLERAVTECEAAIKGEAPFDAEFRVRHQDGTILWIKANAKVLRDQEGNPVRMVGINRDITEHKTADEERAKFQAQLLQSQKMESLGTLAGGVAHDMNNVLGAILGLASAHIGNQPYGSPLHKALDTICKATERGGKMVKSLLGFARQSPVENNRIDMGAILQEQVSFLKQTTLAKVHMQMDLEADLRPIQGDASALTHAFMNLCVNAVDAMPENGTLTLQARNVDNNWIEVVVEDNGSGMPKEVLDRALDPFFTTKGVGKGTGLGLSMVFSTVKAHRGQMAIESEPGQGTRVRLRFPACKNETQVIAIAAADATMIHSRTLKVLLVDDDDLIQSSVQAILECLGHTVVNTALSGEEALAMLESGLEPDVVILDMNMPGLGGTGTLPRLRMLRPEVPVLLSTGRVDQAALKLAAAHPGITLLSKPFGVRELQQHLENIGLGSSADAQV
jgi:PAS domain S-box-containing protein